MGARFDSLADQLAIVTGMWSTPVGETFSHHGTVHSVIDSPALPKPTQSPLPIVIGGGGKSKTPALAAQYAAEFNLPFRPLSAFTEQVGRVRAAGCEKPAAGITPAQRGHRKQAADQGVPIAHRTQQHPRRRRRFVRVAPESVGANGIHEKRDARGKSEAAHGKPGTVDRHASSLGRQVSRR